MNLDKMAQETAIDGYGRETCEELESIIRSSIGISAGRFRQSSEEEIRSFFEQANKERRNK